jgi:hypothetical protein
VRSYSKETHPLNNSNLEIKISSCEGRYKTSTKDFDLDKIINFGIIDVMYGICKPKLKVTYERVYYKIFNVRSTIDSKIEYSSLQGHGIVFEPNEIAVEIKADEKVSVEYLMRFFPFNRARFSKYSSAVTMLMKNYKV